jgi:GT2 family glycosyltransferase
MILDIVYRHHNADPERARFFATANLAMTASAFRSLGGFDTRFRSAAAEDREFCDRCRFQGYSMAYAPDAVVAHHHELSFLRFCRQQFNYGRGACDFQQIRAQRGSGTLLEDLKFHLNARHWLRDLFAQVSWRETIPLAANLAFWQLSYTAGFFGESLRRKLRRHA